MTGGPGIAVATRGPGAVSATNGVANALLERVPMVLITDCVYEADSARVSRQRVDQRAVFAPLTLASLALNGKDARVAQDSVAMTVMSPPGPVHVDIDPTAITKSPSRRTPSPTDPAKLLDQVARHDVR